MQEIWKDIVGYEGLYQVSNLGRIKSLARIDTLGHKRKEHIMAIRTNKRGYQAVNLFKGKEYTHKIHRLVALAFIPNPHNYPMINHKDENPSNNCVNNLEWCDAKYNSNYGTRNDKISKAQLGKEHPWQKGNNNYFHTHIFKGRDNVCSKEVYQYDKNNKFIRKYDSVREASKNIGVSESMVGMVCRGIRNNAKGYIFSYEPLHSV